MKYFFLVCLAFTACVSAGQSDSSKKNVAISFSYGIPDFAKSNLRKSMQDQLNYLQGRGVNTDASVSYKVHGFGPITLKFDIPVLSWLSVGPVLAYSQAGIDYRFLNPTATNQSGYVLRSTNTDLNTYNMYSFTGGIRVNFHPGKNKAKVDPYIGFALGYKHTLEVMSQDFENPFFGIPSGYTVFDKWYENPDPKGPLYFALSVGLREYLTKNFGVMIEAGIDNWSFVQAGIVLKTN